MEGNMARRAQPSGRRLTPAIASLIRGMAERGDRHHDIAACFGLNQGRIAEVLGGERFPEAPIAPAGDLPPPGPYPTGLAAHNAATAPEVAKTALAHAMGKINDALAEIQRRR